MKDAANEAGIKVVAGDTKVVENGKADRLFINTTGVGVIPDSVNISGKNAKPGDVIILSGSIGDHGIAVLEARGELGFETGIASDVAPLNTLISSILNTYKDVHVMRDPTRGGLATTLNEIAIQSNIGIEIYEESIVIDQAVETACEIMGFDPLYVANEGKVIIIVDEKYSNKILKVMRNHRYGKRANIIGKIISDPKGRVLMRTRLGTSRIVDMLSGEMLPRIC
jgi:hydrogenase expression/formation protein HypE